MSELPPAPWIHIGECPVCVNGLCRVRTCVAPDHSRHLYAMCDECEALWITPSTEPPPTFPDVHDPRCPLCGQPLYGPQADWAAADHLEGTPWLANAIFDLPSGETTEAEANEAASEDLSYGQDDPRPGC